MWSRAFNPGLRGYSRKSAIDKKSDDFTYKHFHGLGHHGLQDVGVQIIDLVNGKRNVLWGKESGLTDWEQKASMLATSFSAKIKSPGNGKKYYNFLNSIKTNFRNLLKKNVKLDKKVLVSPLILDYNPIDPLWQSEGCRRACSSSKIVTRVIKSFFPAYRRNKNLKDILGRSKFCGDSGVSQTEGKREGVLNALLVIFAKNFNSRF